MGLVDKSAPRVVIKKGHRRIVILRRHDGLYEIENGKDNWITQDRKYVESLFSDML